MPRRIIGRIQEEGRELRKEVRACTMGYILTGLGFVAGLAWNDAIGAFIEEIVPVGRNTLLAKFFYAVLVTFVVVIVSGYLARLLSERTEDPEKVG